jgi:magnesium transporter
MALQTTPALQDIRQQIDDLLTRGDLTSLQAYLIEQHPADIADALELLDDDQRVVIFDLLQTKVAAEVLDETLTEITRELTDALPDEKIADLLEEMPMDDAAEVLSELREGRAEDLIGLMEPEEAADVKSLLAYPDESAGRLMTTKVVRLKASWTAAQALNCLRQVDNEIETLTYLYIVNGNQQLVGVLPVWSLLTAPLDKPLSELMDTDVISVNVDTDQEEVARIISQYDFFAIPVIDHQQHFVGIITHDDVIDILVDEFSEDMQRLGGSEPLEHTYFSTPIPKMIRKRIGWLLLLFVTATLTGTVMRVFDDTLAQVLALSFFIPLLIGTGGNAGSQMTATMIRALAVGEVHFQDIWRVFSREMVTGLILGTILGLAGLLRAVTWDTSYQLALTVALSICALVIWANLIGMLLPLIAQRLNMDPTVISGPLVITLVDTTGLLIYFTLAQLILNL